MKCDDFVDFIWLGDSVIMVLWILDEKVHRFPTECNTNKCCSFYATLLGASGIIEKTNKTKYLGILYSIQFFTRDENPSSRDSIKAALKKRPD